MYPCSVGIVSHKDLAHGGLSLSGKDYMKSSLIGGPSGEIFLAQGGGGGPLGRMYPCSVGIALRGGLDIGLAHRDLGPLGRQVPNLVLPDLYTILTEWSASSPTPLSHNLLLSHLLSWVGNIKANL